MKLNTAFSILFFGMLILSIIAMIMIIILYHRSEVNEEESETENNIEVEKSEIHKDNEITNSECQKLTLNSNKDISTILNLEETKKE